MKSNVAFSLVLAFSLLSASGFSPLLYAKKTTETYNTTTNSSIPKATQEDNAELQRILRKLIEDNHLQVQDAVIEASYVKNEEEINAYTDSTRIVVYSRLWYMLKTDEARAFLVGHELGHITNRHKRSSSGRVRGLRIATNVVAIGGGLLLGGIPGVLVGASSGYTVQLVNLKFNRKQEYQADDSGMQYMIQAGYDKNGAIAVFDALQLISQSEGVELLRTHPLTDARVKKLVEKYALTPSPYTFSKHYTFANDSVRIKVGILY